jgi:Domain of unknown function (DUF4189)
MYGRYETMQVKIGLTGLFGLVIALLFWPTDLLAQTFVCPNGPGPGEIQVGTTGGSGGVAVIPICASDGSEDSSDSTNVEPQGPIWEARWGAVAIGGGGFGAVADQHTERVAIQAATKQCQTTAADRGKNCKALSYYNQCAVLAWGSNGYIFQRAVDLPTATSEGMQKCSTQYDDCQIYYSACSLPKRVN